MQISQIHHPTVRICVNSTRAFFLSTLLSKWCCCELWPPACEKGAENLLLQLLVVIAQQHNNSNAVVTFQLDYYMSPQFAGVACAMVNDLYMANGISTLNFLPTCPAVGLEPERVRQHQDAHPTRVTIGCVEQNIFIPTLAANPALQTTAIAAMFRRSPLCIASKEKLGQEDGSSIIGAHKDTVELLQRIFPHHKVIASPRATKNTDLMADKLQGIQAYTTTEVPTLTRGLLGNKDPPVVTYLEGLNNGTTTTTKLGYGQMLFTANENLQDNDRCEVVQAFLDAMFQGWEMSIRHPEQAVEMVRLAKK